jgi:hypothetical protein
MNLSSSHCYKVKNQCMSSLLEREKDTHSVAKEDQDGLQTPMKKDRFVCRSSPLLLQQNIWPIQRLYGQTELLNGHHKF